MGRATSRNIVLVAYTHFISGNTRGFCRDRPVRFLERAIDLHGVSGKTTIDKSGASMAVVHSVQAGSGVNIELRQSKYLTSRSTTSGENFVDFCHGSILSKVEAVSKPGAVQTACLQTVPTAICSYPHKVRLPQCRAVLCPVHHPELSSGSWSAVPAAPVSIPSVGAGIGSAASTVPGASCVPRSNIQPQHRQP